MCVMGGRNLIPGTRVQSVLNSNMAHTGAHLRALRLRSLAARGEDGLEAGTSLVSLRAFWVPIQVENAPCLRHRLS